MAVIELVEALTVGQQAVGEAERARGTQFASGAGAAAASGEVTADAVEVAEDTPGTDAGTDEAQEIVTDVFTPDGERQDDGDVTPEPTAQNTAVVDDPTLSPELADAAAAEINAAETTDAATASTHAPGGDAEPDPK
jgi:large subunit ribosomal protein L17